MYHVRQVSKASTAKYSMQLHIAACLQQAHLFIVICSGSGHCRFSSRYLKCVFFDFFFSSFSEGKHLGKVLVTTVSSAAPDGTSS